jgi:hypothetical protein
LSGEERCHAVRAERRARCARRRIDRNEPGINGIGDDPLGTVGGRLRRLIVRNAATRPIGGAGGISLGVIAPDLSAGQRIERNDVVVAGADIKASANLERRDLE